MIYLNTKPIVKPKKKPKAEREKYAAWCAKYGIDPSGKTKKKKDVIRNITLPGTVYKPFIRETVKYPSLDTGHKGAVTTGLKKHTYTGDKMLGVATMHKSNLVPIFSDDSAVEVSQMKR
jgi:predicted transglutaminase-like protease